jgi:hypothetical protein
MARVKNAGPREHTVRDLFDIAKQAGYEIPRGVTYLEWESTRTGGAAELKTVIKPSRG